MSMQQQNKRPPAEAVVGDDEIADLLRADPHFFERHESLLLELKLPHPCGSAVSLVERQITLMRQQNDNLRRKMMELVRVARDNSSTHERVHRLTLALFDTGSGEEVLDTVQAKLRDEFFADLVRFHLFNPIAELGSSLGIHTVSRDDRELALFSDFFAMRRPLCGRLRADQVHYLFGDDAEQIGSAVLIPLVAEEELGMLAIGSYSEERFHPGMGTLVLGQLGELISTALNRYR